MDDNETLITVAYALPDKKIKSFITKSLTSYAKQRGINLVQLDPLIPLDSQLPFDILIHKLYAHNWTLILHDFHTNHPNIPIIDYPSFIKRLHHRDSMLQFIPGLFLSLPSSFSLGIPQQVFLDINEDTTAATATATADLNLQFPIIAKPLVADGKPDSHILSLVLNSTGLQKLKQQAQASLVLQQFINHGGVLFKVYVAGNHVKCVQRKSLPDFHISDFSPAAIEEGIVPLSQLSNLPATNTDSTTKLSQQEADVAVAMPPCEFVNNLATAVRDATQLHLFNIDLIRDVSVTDGNRYLVIDINYFPGYAKVPDFEAMITDFFLDVVHKDATA